MNRATNMRAKGATAADQARGWPAPGWFGHWRLPTGRRAETRQRILTAAGNLFREHGIDGVGVDAVIKEAGLTHGGFYLHFPSKEALAAEVSQTLLEKAAGKWDELSRSSDRQGALERIVTQYFNPKRPGFTHGCPLTTLGADVARRGASKEAIGGALADMLDALTRTLPGRRRQNSLTALSTMVGAVVLSRLAADPKLAEAFLAAAAASILPASILPASILPASILPAGKTINRSASIDERQPE